MGTHSNLSYRCYILPIIGAIFFYLLSLPIVNQIFYYWIPDYYYATFVKALLLLTILFLFCRLLDIYWFDYCHDGTCTANLQQVCYTILENNNQIDENINNQTSENNNEKESS